MTAFGAECCVPETEFVDREGCKNNPEDCLKESARSQLALKLVVTLALKLDQKLVLKLVFEVRRKVGLEVSPKVRPKIRERQPISDCQRIHIKDYLNRYPIKELVSNSLHFDVHNRFSEI